MSRNSDRQQLEPGIADPELRFENTNAQVRQNTTSTASNGEESFSCPSNDNALHPATSIHALLLLSDSALPLGSFAFSSGLESYIAHHKPLPPTTTPVASFHHFLNLSVSSLASAALPYVLAAYRRPETIATLDNDFDASTPCTVARRASVAQGRALLSVWERSFRPACNTLNTTTTTTTATNALLSFSTLLKSTPSNPSPTHLGANGHFAPLWSLVCQSMAVPLSQTTYVFLFNHAKAVLSAAVRAGVMGPYHAQGVLASAGLQERIGECVKREWETRVEDAGQVVPVMDLWVGRHEVLYSRIFNS